VSILNGLRRMVCLACRACKGCSICLAYRVHMKLLEYPQVPATSVFNMDVEALCATFTFISAVWPNEVRLHHDIASHTCAFLVRSCFLGNGSIMSA
jgi:hypothetical protein